MTQEEIEAKRALMRQQQREIGTASRLTITCAGCSQALPLRSMYRCYECGLYYCVLCGKEHWPEAAAARAAS